MIETVESSSVVMEPELPFRHEPQTTVFGYCTDTAICNVHHDVVLLVRTDYADRRTLNREAAGHLRPIVARHAAEQFRHLNGGALPQIDAGRAPLETSDCRHTGL